MTNNYLTKTVLWQSLLKLSEQINLQANEYLHLCIHWYIN